jgi:hypothetical protein
LTVELENFCADLRAQLAVLPETDASLTNGTGAAFVPTLVGSTSVLYFDHLVHGTPDNHVEAAAR